MFPMALQGQQHSAQIFSLAVLLSSIFIYNQIGAIDAIAIERLAMVCELTKVIKEKTPSGAQGASGAATCKRCRPVPQCSSLCGWLKHLQ